MENSEGTDNLLSDKTVMPNNKETSRSYVSAKKHLRKNLRGGANRLHRSRVRR
jgi:hypothetical protein